MNAPSLKTDLDTSDQLRDFAAEQLGFVAVQVACSRMFLDIGDHAGLAYSMEAGRIHYRAALEALDGLKRKRAA